MNRELILSSLANNGSFALEYHLLGINKENLLKDGIEYCKLILHARFEQPSYIYYSDLEKFDKITTIQKYYSCSKLVEYSQYASEIIQNLEDILKGKDIKLSEEKIREYQHFFNETSHIFIVNAMHEMVIRKELKEKYRF